MDLYCFVKVAYQKSITRTAHHLHLTQPALTSRLQKLEAKLGVQLLLRSSKGIKLTEEGSLFLKHAIRILKELNAIETELNKLQEGYNTIKSNH